MCERASERTSEKEKDRNPVQDEVLPRSCQLSRTCQHFQAIMFKAPPFTYVYDMIYMYASRGSLLIRGNATE